MYPILTDLYNNMLPHLTLACADRPFCHRPSVNQVFIWAITAAGLVYSWTAYVIYCDVGLFMFRSIERHNRQAYLYSVL